MVGGGKKKERGDYRKGIKERNVSSKRKLGYPGLTIVLPISPNLSSTCSFASSHKDAMDKNGWSEEASRKRERTTEKPTKKETWARRENRTILVK